MLPYILTKACCLPAQHLKNAEVIQPGRIYVAPQDRHMLLRKGYVRFAWPARKPTRPAIDALFRSAMAGLVEPEPTLRLPAVGVTPAQ
jgi:two-component system, chemotaxis family, protein-glutamate methylesterase/glutaminase